MYLYKSFRSLKLSIVFVFYPLYAFGLLEYFGTPLSENFLADKYVLETKPTLWAINEGFSS